MSGRKAMLKSPGDVSGAFVVLMAGVAGFGPANAGVRVRAHRLATPHYGLVGHVGIEPTALKLESDALPVS